EASNCFPTSLAALRDWKPPWQAAPAAPPAPAQERPAAVERSPEEEAAFALLKDHSASVEALARLLGVEPTWAAAPARAADSAAGVALSPEEEAARGLLTEHPQTAAALAALLGK